MGISIIVEYAALDFSDDGPPYRVFDEQQWGEHPYWGGIISRLKTANGLYIFYDSAMKPLYVGVAVTPAQSIWKRANQSFNEVKERRYHIMSVAHPTRKSEYEPGKVKKIKRTRHYGLFDVAHYFSAYEVTEDLVYGLEAFAIRAFGGNLLNIKMEGGRGGLGLPPVDEE